MSYAAELKVKIIIKAKGVGNREAAKLCNIGKSNVKNVVE